MRSAPKGIEGSYMHIKNGSLVLTARVCFLTAFLCFCYSTTTCTLFPLNAFTLCRFLKPSVRRQIKKGYICLKSKYVHPVRAPSGQGLQTPKFSDHLMSWPRSLHKTSYIVIHSPQRVDSFLANGSIPVERDRWCDFFSFDSSVLCCVLAHEHNSK